MRSANVLRIILGGILAGLVVLVGDFVLDSLLLGGPWIPGADPFGQGSVACVLTLHLGSRLVLGLLVVITYVWFLRHRRASLVTAIVAGLFVWGLLQIYLKISRAAAGQCPPEDVVLIEGVWNALVMTISSIAGSCLLRETSPNPSGEQR